MNQTLDGQKETVPYGLSTLKKSTSWWEMETEESQVRKGKNTLATLLVKISYGKPENLGLILSYFDISFFFLPFSPVWLFSILLQKYQS